MADQDEYQFMDPDAFEQPETLEPEAFVEERPKPQSSSSPRGGANPNQKPPVRRNALIAVVVLVVSVTAYHYATKPSLRPATAMKTVPKPKVSVPAPVVQTSTATEHTHQQLSSLEDSQQNLQTEVSNVSDHVSQMDERITLLMMKMEEMNQMMAQLKIKMDDQSAVIERLITVRTAPKPIKRIKHTTVGMSEVMYYVEAVIPGRAWLMGSNGTTLTVSVGSKVPGYGRVRFIDVRQGRVLMSTGKVIQFSVEDR